jgi:hypothetical protein
VRGTPRQARGAKEKKISAKPLRSEPLTVNTCSASRHCCPLSSAEIKVQHTTASAATPSRAISAKASSARPHCLPLASAEISAE